MWVLGTSIVVAVLATALVVMKKNSAEPLSNSIGYPCWALQTIGLSLLAGHLAAKKDYGNKVLVVEIATIVVAFICTFLGGKILKITKTDKITTKLGPTFVILSIVLATVLIAA
jgi:hypothetical protein